MMHRELNCAVPPQKLTELLRTSGVYSRFRRRAVLTRGAEKAGMVGCTLEAMPVDEDPPPPLAGRSYANALMFEDWLTQSECLAFVDELQEGHLRLGDVHIERDGTAQWRIEQVPLENQHMHRAGYVAAATLKTQYEAALYEPLFNVTEPYYPNLLEAARDWLPFRLLRSKLGRDYSSDAVRRAGHLAHQTFYSFHESCQVSSSIGASRPSSLLSLRLHSSQCTASER